MRVTREKRNQHKKTKYQGGTTRTTRTHTNKKKGVHEERPVTNHSQERKKYYALPCGRCPDIICDVRDWECVCDCGAAIDDRFCFFDSLDLSLPLSGAESVTFTFGFEPPWYLVFLC